MNKRAGTTLTELAVAAAVALLAFGFALAAIAPAARCAARVERLDAVEGTLALRRWLERDLASATSGRLTTGSLVLIRSGADGASLTVEYREDKDGRVLREERDGKAAGQIAHVARVFRGSFAAAEVAARAGFSLQLGLAQAQTFRADHRSRLAGRYRTVRAGLADPLLAAPEARR